MHATIRNKVQPFPMARFSQVQREPRQRTSKYSGLLNARVDRISSETALAHRLAFYNLRGPDAHTNAL
jgi:hypothetical protein